MLNYLKVKEQYQLQKAHKMDTVIDFDEAYLDLKNMGMQIPEHTQHTLDNYFIRGWMPGGFCEALLAKDYDRALAIADTANRQMFWAIAMWIREHAPVDSFGSYEAVDDWVNDVNGVRTEFARKADKSYVWRKLKESK